jgi:alpha-D-ribose 1-methylphosphonate 5-triphosphate synthase subunit PhnG
MAEVNMQIAQRQHWMRLMARAEPDALESVWKGLDIKPDFEILRAPESGMVMVRARAGGEGQRFNLGEMTVTRCSVRLNDGIMGHAYLAGRNKRQAQLAAIFDAMLQKPDCSEAFKKSLLEPIQTSITAKQDQSDRKVAATRVNFFTMVRGDD